MSKFCQRKRKTLSFSFFPLWLQDIAEHLTTIYLRRCDRGKRCLYEGSTPPGGFPNSWVIAFVPKCITSHLLFLRLQLMLIQETLQPTLYLVCYSRNLGSNYWYPLTLFSSVFDRMVQATVRLNFRFWKTMRFMPGIGAMAMTEFK